MRKKGKATASASSTDAPATPEPAAPGGPKAIGRQLRELRRERGLSRAEVARSAGLTKRELASYESGRTEIPDHDLHGLAGSCGVDVADLVPGATRSGDASDPAAPPTTATDAPATRDPADDFFAAPRAADPFAPPPPLSVEPVTAPAAVAPAREEPVAVGAVAATVPVAADAIAGATLPVTADVPVAAAAPVAAAPVAPPPVAATADTSIPAPVPERVLEMAGAPGMADTATPPAYASVVSEPYAPVTDLPAPASPDQVPPYWGIGGEEIFLWGDRSVHAAAAASTASAPGAPTTASAPVAPPADVAPIAPESPAPVPDPVAPVAPTSTADPGPTAAPATPPAATADIAWQIGGTIEGPTGDPTAATRWALSDLRVPGDTTIEAVLDFAAGTGFGVLFRATVDGHDRMSGYSFDVDPLGSAYVVRQWVDNLPHWRTLAQTPASPSRQYGRHAMTITLVGDAMTAWVDGVEVMTIPSLGEASIATGCEPARGHRLGLQATPTAEVTVESFRATPA